MSELSIDSGGTQSAMAVVNLGLGACVGVPSGQSVATTAGAVTVPAAVNRPAWDMSDVAGESMPPRASAGSSRPA